MAATIVIVGVADSITALIAEHQSISRNTTQVPVEPMNAEELRDIISKGFSRAGRQVERGRDEKIAELSQGYPSYTHLLGQWAGRRAVEHGRMEVILADLDAAIPDALTNVTGGVAQEYEQAIQSNHAGSLFADVLLACALALGTHSAAFLPKICAIRLRRSPTSPARRELTNLIWRNFAKTSEAQLS